MKTTTTILAIIAAFGMLGIATGMMMTAQPAHAAPGQDGFFHGCSSHGFGSPPGINGFINSGGQCNHPG